jgi:hypothetical protein
MRLELLVPSLFYLALSALPASAKPLPRPTLEQALRSPLIVLARYERSDPRGATYFGEIPASYSIQQIWKGELPQGTQEITLGYRFQDGSACIPPQDWAFSKDMLPKVGATFVLFLSPYTSPVKPAISYQSYRGPFGRWPADSLQKSEREFLQKLVKALPAPCSKCSKKHARLLRRVPKGMVWESRCAPDQKPWREQTFAFERAQPAK